MTKQFKFFETDFGGRKFIIEEDFDEVGVYLLVYENEKPIRDYLQNDIETCKKQAKEEFGVPVENWKFKGFKGC